MLYLSAQNDCLRTSFGALIEQGYCPASLPLGDEAFGAPADAVNLCVCCAFVACARGAADEHGKVGGRCACGHHGAQGFVLREPLRRPRRAEGTSPLLVRARLTALACRCLTSCRRAWRPCSVRRRLRPRHALTLATATAASAAGERAFPTCEYCLDGNGRWTLRPEADAADTAWVELDPADPAAAARVHAPFALVPDGLRMRVEVRAGDCLYLPAGWWRALNWRAGARMCADLCVCVRAWGLKDRACSLCDEPANAIWPVCN